MQIDSIINSDVISLIIYNLDVKSTGRFSRTCKGLSEKIEQGSIWENLVKKTIVNPPLNLNNYSWKKYLKENWLINFEVRFIELWDYADVNSIGIATIDLKNSVITFPMSNPYSFIEDLLDQAFNHINDSFTLINERPLGISYYYYDKEGEKSEISTFPFFNWTNQNIQEFHKMTYLNNDKIDEWTIDSTEKKIDSFNALKSKPGTKNFNVQYLKKSYTLIKTVLI